MNTTLPIETFALLFGFTGTVLMAEEKPEAILARASWLRPARLSKTLGIYGRKPSEHKN
jgi:hypothetical protein